MKLRIAKAVLFSIILTGAYYISEGTHRVVLKNFEFANPPEYNRNIEVIEKDSGGYVLVVRSEHLILNSIIIALFSYSFAYALSSSAPPKA